MARCGHLTLFVLFAILFLVLNEQHLVSAKKNDKKNNITKTEINHKNNPLKPSERKKAEETKKAIAAKTKKAIKKTIEALGNVVDTLGIFIPQAAEAIEIARQLWDSFTTVTGIITDEPEEKTDSEKLDEITNDLKDIKSGQDKTHDMLEMLKITIPKEIDKDEKVATVYELAYDVLDSYKKFAIHKTTNASREGLVKMCETAVHLTAKDGVSKTLHKLHLAVNGINSAVTSLRDLLTDSELVKEMMCKNQYSPMFILFDLYSNICIAELKGLILMRGCYDALKTGNQTYEIDIRNYENAFKTRLTISTKRFKAAMKRASRDFWKCSPKKASEYAKLSPIFTNHITPEEDAALVEGEGKEQFVNYRWIYENCKFYDDKKVIDTCGTDFCREGYRCNGYLQGCYHHEQGSDMTICLADRKSGKKYTKVQINNEVFGKDDECSNEKHIEATPFLKFVAWMGHNCMCTCDDHFNDDADRYFNLREVTSDIDNNKVIVGARIMKTERMFEFEIQEGTLVGNGNVDQTSLKWKSNSTGVFDYGVKMGVDYHKITWDERRVNLDELHASPGTVLTGLKFSVDNDAIKLAIRYTSYDFETGELYKSPEDSLWFSIDDDINERHEIDFNRNVPPSSVHTPKEIQNGYIEFKPSSLESDVGQTVVPYVDLQRLELNPATLLSGAALIYKESSHTTGYLSMKLFTYDYTDHLE